MWVNMPNGLYIWRLTGCKWNRDRPVAQSGYLRRPMIRFTFPLRPEGLNPITADVYQTVAQLLALADQSFYLRIWQAGRANIDTQKNCLHLRTTARYCRQFTPAA